MGVAVWPVLCVAPNSDRTGERRALGRNRSSKPSPAPSPTSPAPSPAMQSRSVSRSTTCSRKGDQIVSTTLEMVLRFVFRPELVAYLLRAQVVTRAVVNRV